MYLVCLELDIEAPDEDSAFDLAIRVADNATSAWSGTGLNQLTQVISADVGAITPEDEAPLERD